MENAVQVLTHVPWWVYLLAIYIGKVGLQATRSAIVPIKKLVITPLIFMYLSAQSLLNQPNTDYIHMLAFGIAVFTGILVGWRIVSQLPLVFDKERFLVQLPGTWSTMMVMAGVFGSKFYLGYETAQGNAATEAALIALVLSAFCTGIITGRVAGYFYRFINSQSVTLTG